MREIKLAFSNSITESPPSLQPYSKYGITNLEMISDVNVSIKLIDFALKQKVAAGFKICAFIL